MDDVTPSPIAVLVVDDDPLVRAALRIMLDGDDTAVVGEAVDGTDALHKVSDLDPHVVLMDIRMPGLDGLAATEAIRAVPDPPEIIVLTTFDTDEHVLRALRAGAAGFLLKDTPPAEILDAVRRVARGDAQLSPSVLRQVIQHATTGHARNHAAAEKLAALTDREREIAQAIGKGLSNAEIARSLHLSIPTVKAHVSAVLDKLGTSNRVQVALMVHHADAT